MNTKIAIGIPTTGLIRSQTALCLMETMRLPYDIFPIFRHGSYISDNRNKIVDIAMENKCTHIFFVDHDMRFHASTLKLLLEQDKDVIGAKYNYRFMPLTPMVKFFDKEGKVVNEGVLLKETFKVAGIGTGCLLIKASVFEKIGKPYFPMEYDKEGNITCTEDMGFCEKVRNAGMDIWCDPAISVSHIGEYAF